MEPMLWVLIGLLGLVVLAGAAMLLMAGLVPLFRLIGNIIRRITAFIAGEIADSLRLTGSILTAALLVPLAFFSVGLGRWSAAAHYGRAIQSEFKTAGLCIYRMGLGHPFKLLAFTPLAEGIEKRLPQVVKAAPGKDRPNKRIGLFEGYTIVGSLAGGGSGGKLYVAEPDEIRRAAFNRQGHGDVGQVVIKAFSLKDGSSLPQIVRESRSLDAARKLGLVLDHELNDERFYYVMKFVPGESMALVTQRLHASCGPEGLSDAALLQSLGFVRDLLFTLETYHRGGLWHKDVKPDNIIVEGEKAHLVDLGLITPLRSAMTLTTHGTEYFRDPELVRMALRGVKVQEVDGGRFDLYAAGAVLYSIIENSFPAHGGLSRITRRCPECIRWIVRRAMTDYDKRYPTAAAMLADVAFVLASGDPQSVRPADLPSMREGDSAAHTLPVHEVEAPLAAHVAAAPAEPVDLRRRRPRLAVSNWFTGAYEVRGEDRVAVAPSSSSKSVRIGPVVIGMEAGVRRAQEPAGPRSPRPQGARRPASEQLAAARQRAAAVRERARERRAARRSGAATDYKPGVNLGVAFAILLVLGVVGAGVVAIVRESSHRVVVRSETPHTDPAASITSGPAISSDAQTSAPPALNDPGQPRPLGTPVPPAIGEAGFGPAQLALLGAAGGTQVARQLLAGGRIVLVISQTPAIDEPSREQLAALVARLRGAGYRVIGAGLENERELAAEAEAQLRKARALRSVTAPETREAIESWIKAQRDIAFVVWVEAEPAAAPKPRLFAPEPSRDGGFEAYMFQRMINDYIRGVIEFASTPGS